MHNKLLKFSTVLLLGSVLTGLQAQTSVNAAGGNVSGSGGSIRFSIGQAVYTTNIGTGGSVIQGVQQPYEISVVTAVKEARGINLTVSAYPNPAVSCLTLQVNCCEFSDLHYQLYDMQGKLIQEERITGPRTNIVMENLLPATYFLKIIKEKTEFKTFKIIKN